MCAGGGGGADERGRVGQRATEQGRALLSPCHRLVPLGVEGARVYVCVCV